MLSPRLSVLRTGRRAVAVTARGASGPALRSGPEGPRVPAETGGPAVISINTGRVTPAVGGGV